ncbi:MAG: cytochrome c oxidase subunit 3 [Anaerolineae bacterium]|nr:cytochrome c oxidase subunit 3 [Anaerolineae bacterium]
MTPNKALYPMDGRQKLQPIHDPRRKNLGLFGAIVFIVSESMFFMGVFLVWFYLRETSPAWPPLGIARPNIALPVVNTVIMAISTIAMIIAERGVARDNQRALINGTAIAAATGLLFMTVMILEFASLGFNPTTNAFGSSFVMVLVFHVLRVFAGVVIMAVVLVRALLGQLNSSRRALVQACAVYWYFIASIWLIVFYFLYIKL